MTERNEDWRDVVDVFFRRGRGLQLVQHQLESYDLFVRKYMPETIQSFNPVCVHQYGPGRTPRHTIELEFREPRLMRPIIHENDGSTRPMLPVDARQRGLSYSAQLLVDLHVTAKTHPECEEESATVVDAERKILRNVQLGKIPIMVRSSYCALHDRSLAGDECRYDYGGYFLINGNEKVVVSQDRISENKTFVFVNPKLAAFSHIAEVRSVHEKRPGIPKVTAVKLLAKSTNPYGCCIRVTIHFIKHEIPIVILFKALGLPHDLDVVRCVLRGGDPSSPDNHPYVDALVASIEEAQASGVATTQDAVLYLARQLMQPTAANNDGGDARPDQDLERRFQIVRSTLERELFPHVEGAHASRRDTDLAKARYLGRMVRRMLACRFGQRGLDDRDAYTNKRIDVPGVLVASLFRQSFAKVVKDVRNMTQRELTSGGWRATNRLVNVIGRGNVSRIVKSTIIESNLRYALSTGNWGMKSAKTKQGVAQVLNRMTYAATLSHLRRVHTPVERSGKLVQPRKLHPTQWGMLCPSETPEGASVGLVKNLAMTACITSPSDPDIARSLLRPSLVEAGTTDVFVNGAYLGGTDRADELYAQLKEWKRTGMLHPYASIVRDCIEDEVRVCTEGGRCVRPLFVVGAKDRASKNDWIEWMRSGRIEFLDVEETNAALIAMTPKDLERDADKRYTHLEIHPSLIFGVMASLIPFSDNNQAPRNTYQSAQCKQAIGVYASNYRERYDSVGHVLHYPQQPLVKTHMSTLLHNDRLPNGINAIVAIACYTGFNQEDSVILNRSAVERGLFVSTSYKTFREQNNRNHATGQEEIFAKPDVPDPVRALNYDKLDDDGFVPPGTPVEGGDVIIGKCLPIKDPVTGALSHKDKSVALKHTESGVIDRNAAHDRYFCNVNGDGYAFAKVRMRTVKVPVVGDKVSSRSGQKGTCGILLDQQDMPFTEDGIVPDLIINPNAIPSRMTIGQLLESVLGIACTDLGRYGDATPFGDASSSRIASLAELLEKDDIPMGDRVLYDGRTGERMSCSIFVGPTYYQRLKHMSADKIHSRANAGPIVLLTRQPAEGRARQGALRAGEMEVHTLWAHGDMQFLKERLVDCSDNYRVHVCRACGRMAVANPEQRLYSCRNCKSSVDVAEVRVPYAYKLLMQELATMSIAVGLSTE